MAARPTRTIRSIWAPIVLGSISVALSIALLVGWIAIIASSPTFSSALAANVSLLVGGAVSLIVIMTVLVLFVIFLAREVQEVRRQYSFIDSVTHELKSPLASLKLCLETSARKELDEAQRSALRDMMMKDVDRLNLFIDDILEATRLSHGTRAYSLERLSLRPLLDSAVATIIARYESRDNIAPDISVESSDDLYLSTDRTALETIVTNLLDNAVKYSKPGEVKVRVRAWRDASGVHVSVRDNGIGIPKIHLNRVFDRFYRVPSEGVYARSGTGLGLFVVSQLARVLGGSMQAQSDGPGTGTLMTLTLPASQDTAS